MHNTINRSIQENCSTEDVIATLNELLDRLSRWRAYVVPIFWIYIAALIVEALATYIAIYRSISNKRRFLRNLCTNSNPKTKNMRNKNCKRPTTSDYRRSPLNQPPRCSSRDLPSTPTTRCSCACRSNAWACAEASQANPRQTSTWLHTPSRQKATKTRP
jgi:hypothetical protein